MQLTKEQCMKTLVAYYSHSGNNKYLPEKTAKDLGADLCPIIPKSPGHIGLLFKSFLNLNIGIHDIQYNIADYHAVILCGPIWMGKVIAPLRTFLKMFQESISKLYFVSCCGSGESNKDGNFGYVPVFAKVKELMQDRLIATQAFSIELITPPELKGNDEAIMKLRLADSNFTGEIATMYAGFIGQFSVPQVAANP
jgi:flavodoxin